jgi:hypothetical protein
MRALGGGGVSGAVLANSAVNHATTVKSQLRDKNFPNTVSVEF